MSTNVHPRTRFRLLTTGLTATACCAVTAIAWIESHQVVITILIFAVTTAWLWAASKAPGATGVLTLAMVLGISLFALLAASIYEARQQSLKDLVTDRQQQIGRALHEQTNTPSSERSLGSELD